MAALGHHRKHIFSTGQKKIVKQEHLNINPSHYYQRRIKNPVKHLRWSFFPKIINGFQPLYFFFKKGPLQMFDWVLNAPLIPSTPPHYFLRENNKNLPISISFATAIHELATPSFSLYPLSYLSNSTGYRFTFSHNIYSSCNVSATTMSTFVYLYHFIY